MDPNLARRRLTRLHELLSEAVASGHRSTNVLLQARERREASGQDRALVAHMDHIDRVHASIMQLGLVERAMKDSP